MIEGRNNFIALSIGVTLFLFSCNGTTEKNSKANQDTIDYSKYGMRSPEPVIVDIPQTIPVEIDTSFYVFHILKTKIVLEHGGEKIEIGDLNQFDSFVKESRIAMLKTRVALQADSLVSNKHIDSVIGIFKTNNIIQFYLITDLEEAPGIK